MNRAHLLRYVIVEALLHLSRIEPRLDGPVPRALLLGTAMVESGLTHLQQTGGPAVGLWQCEPRTHDDVWLHFLAFKPEWHAVVRELTIFDPTHREMRYNLLYAAAIARLVYWRAKEKLPDLEPDAMAAYWKRHYNTNEGRGTAASAAEHFRVAVRHVR